MIQRLLIKVGCGGVDISPLHPSMRYVLWCCGYLWEDNEDVVITSTWDGAHICGSFHPFKKALDISYPPSWNGDGKRDELKELVSKKGIQVVYESDHIHFEYDPKEK